MDDLDLMHYAIAKSMAEFRQLRKYIKELEALISTSPELLEKFQAVKTEYKDSQHAPTSSSDTE